MISDANRGITSIEYNHLNLPTRVTIDYDAEGYIEYVYDAAGSKLSKKVYSVDNNNVPITTDYAGNYIYENGALQFFNHAEGYTQPAIASGSAAISSFEYVYQYKDHLGNIRLSYTDVNGDGVITASTEIIEEKNYYPFGLQHEGYNNDYSGIGNSIAEKFSLNGKELEESLGLNLHEMDMRQYDATIARWTGIDPVTHHNFSTYSAFDNNPVFWADPSGADSETVEEYFNRQVAIDEGREYKGSNVNTSDIVNKQFNSTEDGGRSRIDYEDGTSTFLSARDVQDIFKAIVDRYNSILRDKMWNEAIDEKYKGKININNYKQIYSQYKDTKRNFADIDKMIGKKPWSSFYGSVELDENNGLLKVDYALRGDIMVFYGFGTGYLDGFSMARDENGDPTGQNVWETGQDTITNSNPWGIKFTKADIPTINRFSFKTNELRIKFWNVMKKIKENFKKTLK
ncbi:hypothetical protein BTO06_03600 [Tenacibaculum sp. SZ-18]|uniref:RHS repeat domain-containing protein n=1 Tax=Tenacibaculum sp. SZ-18 TaxID=754423 RepID=UPI000C2D0C63|nr:RHS repeat-associated core domain-containing protein [Tenacibaculum sp. SZ-18]AUC14281.1 hypothetical protein BTO06_03600 [Tenacibaculum sp. SZ-18]